MSVVPTRCITDANWLPRGVFNCALEVKETQSNKQTTNEVIVVLIFINFD